MKSLQSAAFSRRMRTRVRGSALAFAVSLLSIATTTTAFGETSQTGQAVQRPLVPRQGKLYQPVPPAVRNLAQVVMFRAASQQGPGKEAAHVYVNGELEGALMPDGYTRFCVPKGTYSMEAYIGDEPSYAGKSNPKTEIDLEAGRTYFIGVSENGSGEPVPYRRADAERLLKASREQVQVINRAKAVVPCGDQSEPVQKVTPATQTFLKFQLDAAVLFDFGQSDSSAITPAGRAALKKIADQIRALPRENITRVVVRGHADPIGSPSTNLRLSRDRARTVSQVLGQEGIPPQLVYAEGLGSTELVVNCSPVGDMTKRIRCNAPNRRVEINVEGTRSDSDPAN